MRTLLAAMTVLLASGAAGAHSLDPVLLDVREARDGTAAVLWKTAATAVPGARIEPQLPPACHPVGPARIEEGGPSISARWTIACDPDAWVGQRVGVAGLATAGTDALVRIALADGRLVRAVLRPSEPSFVVPARPRRMDVVRDYVRLGIEHILSGPDHLLFVLGLVLLVPGVRRLVGTVTAFTVGHTITLTLAALDYARVPAGPTEVLIALSVLVLAIELARDGSAPSALRRRPWPIALAFGLLHGLGFASALRDAGLPSGEVPLALASFNAGVEAGQLLIIAAVLGVRSMLAQQPLHLPRWSAAVPAYAMGSLAALWCFERLSALVH